MRVDKLSIGIGLVMLVSCESSPVEAGNAASGGASLSAGPATSGSPGNSDTAGGTTADPSTTAATAETNGASSDPSGPDSTPSGTLFDVGASPDGGLTCGASGGMGVGGEPLSYIWIANSSQGTVSKIDTQTMVEQGRYIVRPDSAGSPSRTTVSLSGDVAIANRSGGVTKIWGRTGDCVESNGAPGLQTSTGAADILAWGTDECVAWYTALPYTSNRPMAWAQGTYNPSTCGYVDEKLWTSGYSVGTGTQVLLLDGETGVIEETINLPEVTSGIGLYGGAVDGEGNFWGLQNSSLLVRVDRNTFEYETWPVPGGPGYGIALDAAGRPWLCGGGNAQRFDIATGTFTQTGPQGGIGGCMTDGEGTLWHSRYPQGVLIGIDTDTLAIVAELPIPAYVHGVSVDFDGNIWGVTFASTQAFRVDPESGTVDTFGGLIGAYTYSDMTGFALSVVGTPSG